ncbi:MAG: YncE family protein [Opitutaceae bacterium]|nr:YncE family protein [Opitutaceae bacterium]
MNKGLKIGISALSGIGLGVLFSYVSKDKEEDCGCETATDQKVKKIIDESDQDSFDPIAMGRIKAGLTPSNKRFNKQYKKDLKQWGTRSGVIDVSNDQHEKKKKKQLYSKMGEVGDMMVKEHLPKTTKITCQPKKKLTPLEDWYSWLRKEFDITQVTITNTSTEEKTIRLWGANKGLSVSPPAFEDVEDHEIITTVTIPTTIGVGIHPQGIAVNPVNGFAYVANQLSNNVSVIAADGQIVTIIQLQPSTFPGYNSPVAVAVNSNSASPNYGKVYVVGSVANTVSVIDLTHNVTNEIAVGVRPVDIAFNPVNENLYVANLVGDDVTVIDTTTETVTTTLAVGQDPLGLGINLNNGDIFVTNSTDDSVSVFDSGNLPVATIAGVGTKPVSITYHPVNDEMYAVATGSDNIIPIDTNLYTTLPPIGVCSSPYKIVFNSTNNFLYVGNRVDETYSVIAPDKTIKATIALGNVNIGFGINQTENVLFSSDTAANTVDIIGYSDQSSSITIDDDFPQKSKDFKHSPALVKHVKFVLSGTQRFKVLTLREERVTGTVIEAPITFGNYDSPQNSINVSEMFGMDGVMIDGLNSWLFKIAGLQTISVLVYYKQFEMYNLLPEKSPVAIGCEMSEGIPESWKRKLAKESRRKIIHKPKIL